MTTATQFAPIWNSSGTNYTAIRANVTDIASSGGSMLMDLRLNNNSLFSVGKTGAVTQGPTQLNTLVSTNRGLIVQGAAAQSANLQEWQNSAGTIMALVDRDGDIVAPTGTFGFVQLSSTLPRQSGLLFLDNNGIIHTTPNINYNYSNQASPRLSFRASGSATPDISLNILTTASGSTSGVQTLSFEGSAGQLFSITDVLNSGVIFGVNDISGLPLIEVDATGRVSLGRFGTAIDAHRTVVASEGVISNTFIRNSGNIISATGNYVLSNIDNGEVLVINSSSNRLITVASGLPVGFRLDIIQAGTGPVSVSGAAGVTVNSRSNFTASAGQNSMLRLISTNSNIYYLGGDLA